MDSEGDASGSSGAAGAGDQQHSQPQPPPVSLPPIPMSSLANPLLEEAAAAGGDSSGLDALTAAWESTAVPLGGYSEDDECVGDRLVHLM